MATPQKLYAELAAAFVRGRLGLDLDHTALDDEAALAAGEQAGLRLHRFKRDVRPLPRVSRVIGALRGFAPASLLDIGSGRGAFLWPLLDGVPELAVCAVDRDAARARDLGALRRGGIRRLRASRMDVERLGFANDAFDGVTVLEVLEHLEHPEEAAREVVRVARRFAIASVPSRPDDNLQHIQLFDGPALERLFVDAGAKRVRWEHLLNHLLAFVHLG